MQKQGGLESILSFIAIIALLGAVGTGLDSRPCLVSMLF